MTNISQQLCEICGIEPKRNRVTTQGLSGIHLPDLYPNFEKPENFIKLFNLPLNYIGYKTLASFITGKNVYVDGVKDFLEELFKEFEYNSEAVSTEQIKQAIKSEEWIYG